MTRGRWLEDPNAVKEAERFFTFLGRYVVGFQMLEDLVDESLLLCWPQTQRTERAKQLSKWTFVKKIKKLATILDWAEVLNVEHREVLLPRILTALERMEAERNRRNSILHSSYLFDFLLLGAPVLRSYAESKKSDQEVVHEYMDSQSCNDLLVELSTTMSAVSMLRLQIVHAIAADRLSVERR